MPLSERMEQSLIPNADWDIGALTSCGAGFQPAIGSPSCKTQARCLRYNDSIFAVD